MSYIEFAYMIDFLNANLPEQKVKDILTRKKTKINKDMCTDLTKEGDVYYCKIMDNSACLGYPVRPFRCRGYLRDEKLHMCRPQGSVEIDNKSWRKIWRLDDSVTPIPKEKRAKKGGRENDLDFWIKEILGY
jgi:Fe-S-cluster containining protein